MSEWLQNCNEVGGPSSPSLEECLGVDNGCEGFKEAICDFDQSNIIANFEDLLGPADCQIFCDATPDDLNRHEFSLASLTGANFRPFFEHGIALDLLTYPDKS